MLYPESERAQVNEAIGYEFLGDKERAHTLATELLTAYPHSSKALACWIRTAPKDVELDKLKAKVPAALERDSEICTALTLKQLSRSGWLMQRLSQDSLWLVTRHGQDQDGSWLNRYLTKSWETSSKHWTAQRPIESRRLDEVIVAYTEAIDLAKRQNTTYFMVDCFTGRAVARALKGDCTLADEDFNEAIKSGPDDGAVYFQHAMFLADTTRVDEAISQCRKSIAIKKGVDAEHCLATLLAERAQPGDQKEASDIFARIAFTDDKLLSSITPVIYEDQLRCLRGHAFHAAIDCYLDDSRVENAQRLLEQMPAGRVSDVSMRTARSKVRVAEGNLQDATKLVRTAAARRRVHAGRRITGVSAFNS